MAGAEMVRGNPAPSSTQHMLQPQLGQDSQQAARDNGTATFFPTGVSELRKRQQK